MDLYRFFFKRFFDILLAILCLCFFSPILVIVFVVLLFSNKGKVFFTQDRPGKDGKIFKLLKFKTMSDKKDEKGNLLPDGDRLTKIGIFLRKTSLDESPQVINVLKGDMTVFGPRPLLPEYLTLYNKKQRRRHEVKPGVTGWAQVNGRNSISWEQKFDLDVWYVDNMSFMLDLKILFKSIQKIVKRDGINQENAITTIKFRGNE